MQAAAAKRKTFDSSKQRVTNEAANAAHTAPHLEEISLQPAKRGRSDWRSKSESLRSMLRAAKSGDVMPARDGV